MTVIDSELKTLSYCSKAWANSILKIGIADCKNKPRVESARLQEIFYIMRVLSERGFEWQARRLRNHYHLAIKRGFLQRAKRADPIGGQGGLS